ncbi:MAG: hypothetical protein IPP44_00525 [Ideonella sp.]|nr:hypothetical protein [Ideonella sp.]
MDAIDEPRELIIALLNAVNKASAEAICRRLLMTDELLLDLILAARSGVLSSYKYACHFDDYMPDDATLENMDLRPIVDSPVGPLSTPGLRAFKRIDHIFRARRLLSAHLLYSPSHSHWHLFYFDQRDKQFKANHWKRGGPHVHYSRESYTKQSLTDVWQRIRASPPEVPGHTYIRYLPSAE